MCGVGVGWGWVCGCVGVWGWGGSGWAWLAPTQTPSGLRSGLLTRTRLVFDSLAPVSTCSSAAKSAGRVVPWKARVMPRSRSPSWRSVPCSLDSTGWLPPAAAGGRGANYTGRVGGAADRRAGRRWVAVHTCSRVLRTGPPRRSHPAPPAQPRRPAELQWPPAAAAACPPRSASGGGQRRSGEGNWQGGCRS